MHWSPKSISICFHLEKQIGIWRFQYQSNCIWLCSCTYIWYIYVRPCTFVRCIYSLLHKVSFAKEPYKRDYIPQKSPIILRSLLIVATPYIYVCPCALVWCTYSLLHTVSFHVHRSFFTHVGLFSYIHVWLVDCRVPLQMPMAARIASSVYEFFH